MSSEREALKLLLQIGLVKVEFFRKDRDIGIVGLMLTVEQGRDCYFIPPQRFTNIGEGEIFGCFSVEKGSGLWGKAVAEGVLL